jgi:hypothetical protein
MGKSRGGKSKITSEQLGLVRQQLTGYRGRIRKDANGSITNYYLTIQANSGSIIVQAVFNPTLNQIEYHAYTGNTMNVYGLSRTVGGTPIENIHQ